MNRKVVVAVCGASGSLYGIRLLKALLEDENTVYLVVSATGRQVVTHETGHDWSGGVAGLREFLARQQVRIHPRAELHLLAPDDFFTPPASGSFRHDGMVIAPCSMKTLAAIAAGIADNLVHRSADVCLKEKRPLILAMRETPLNMVHLENMRRAAQAGATIMPACPSFYSRPQSVTDLVDTVVARMLDHLCIDQKLQKPWGEEAVVLV